MPPRRPVLILTHDPLQPPGCLTDLIARRGLTSIALLVREARDLPDDALVSAMGAIVVLGPAADPAQPDWLPAEVELLTRAHARRQRLCGFGRGTDIVALATGLEPEPLVRAVRAWLPSTLHPRAAEAGMVPVLGVNPPELFVWRETDINMPSHALPLLSSSVPRHAAWLDEHVLMAGFHATLDRMAYTACLEAGATNHSHGAGPASALPADAGTRIAAQRRLCDTLLELWLPTARGNL